MIYRKVIAPQRDLFEDMSGKIEYKRTEPKKTNSKMVMKSESKKTEPKKTEPETTKSKSIMKTEPIKSILR